MISYYMITFQLGTYYIDGPSNNSIYMFMNSNVNNYNVIGNSSTYLSASKFYLVSYTKSMLLDYFSLGEKCLES
jgi:hypothetical protein